ncbi:MAG: hypothetical protein ACOCQY_02975 [Halorhabdus sp.]
MSSRDVEEMVQDDMDRFRDLSGDGMEMSFPAILELSFLSLTGVSLIGWFLSLFLFDVDGPTWMGMGMLFLVLFGLPTALIFGLRRGGAEIVDGLIQQIVR